jgi:RHS repeat-associated protein
MKTSIIEHLAEKPLTQSSTSTTRFFPLKHFRQWTPTELMSVLRLGLSLLFTFLLVIEPLSVLSVARETPKRPTTNSALPQATPTPEAATVRHAPIINARVEGSVRQLTGESFTLNSGGVVTGDLFVPGTPTVRLNGSPNYGGTIDGAGSTQPTGYFVTLNSGSTLGRTVRRTDPITLATVAPPPASQGTRNVVINSPGQSPGDFATLRDLTLNGNVGLIVVPPGTYRNFIGNGSNGFVFGVAGSSVPTVYNLNQLTLNGGSQIRVVGPITLTLGNPLTVNGATVGAATNPNWLTLKIASGGLTLNSNSALYGIVRAPNGTVTLNGASLTGSVQSDRLIVNGGGRLTAFAAGPAPTPSLDSITPVRAMQSQVVSITLTGRNTHWLGSQTRASFGGEVSVGGAAAGDLGLVNVVNETTATADLTVSPTAALSPRTVRVVTPLTGGGTEDISLTDGFTVVAVTPPGAASTSVTTIAGSDNTPGFVDGPAAQARFRDLAGIATGADDAIYVADAGNHRVRVVREQSDGSRVVQTLAGDGTAGYRDGAGVQARFSNPEGVAVDAGGAVFVADAGNNRIRRIAPDGTVTTVAGDGTAGYRNGAGAQARFNAPRGVALDQQGNLYVADTGNSAVRLINLSGDVQTVAGDGTAGHNDSPNARFNGLQGIGIDGTTVFIYLADSGNHGIRRLDTSGTVITLTGAERGFADGGPSAARFAEPSGLAIDGAGRIVVADTINSLVRVVTPDLVLSGSPSAVTTVAGTGERGLINGAGNLTRFNQPRGVAISLSSAIIVADTANNVLRRIGIPPVITSFSPPSARVNTAVTIYGDGFDGRGTNRNTVKFTRAGGGQTTAQVTAVTRTQLSVVVPTGAVTGPVAVTTADGTATSPTDFVVDQFAAPAITDFNPKRGPVGTQVTLTGSNLKANANDPTVTFAGSNGRLSALVNSASATEVRTTVPNGAITGVIELTHVGGTSATATAFTVDTEQDFQLTVAPSTTTAVQGGSGTYVVYVTSTQSTFSQLASLSATGLPAGITATFDPAQITAGASSTLTLTIGGTIAPGGYPLTIHGIASVAGHDLEHTAGATLNVMVSGQTTLSGRVLSTEREPIIGATASLDGHTAMTDAAGAFLLSGVTAGANRPLMIDGRTASSPNRTYPVIIEPANLIAGQANVNPYTFYLPPIDTQYEVEVVPGQNTVAGNPRVPGLQMTIPAGANLRNRDGSPITRVSITPLAIDRTPAPLPANIRTGLVYTSQPGGAISDIPMPVTYPNLLGVDPGARVELYAFNHDTVQWYIYGYGRVSTDGKTIAPEIDPSTGRQYGLRDFSWHMPNAGGGGDGGGGGKGCDSCPCTRGDDPVDHSTGIKFETATDVSWGGARGGITLTRMYSSDNSAQAILGRFGRGWKDSYDIRLTGNWSVGGAGRVVMPDEQTGRLFSYARTEGNGTLVFTTTATVSQLGDTVRKLTDGTFDYLKAGGDVTRFDSGGRPTSLVDRNGNTTTLTYTGSNLTQITDPVGRALALSYDSNNRVVSITDPLGGTWHYTYDSSIAFGILDTVTDPLAGVTRYAYTNLRLSSITDPRGSFAKRITYDAAGRVISQQFADNGTENYDYTLSGGIVTSTTITDPLGRKTEKRFNASGYVIGETDSLGQSARVERGIGDNLPISITGPCGCVEATRQFDDRGNVLSSTDQLGHTIRTEYDPVFNRPTKTIDELGHETRYSYDSKGNVLSMTNALSQTTSYTYDQFGELESVTDALGHTIGMEHDTYGNLSATVDASHNRSTRESDVAGRLLRTTDPLGRRASMTYDSLNRMLTNTDPSGAVRRYEYDANGNKTKETNALDEVISLNYDAKNRLVKRIDPLGRTRQITYDSLNEITRTVSPGGRVMTYGWDARGQRASVTDALNGSIRYEYDNRGNLVKVADQRGNTTAFVYDQMSRQVATIDPLGKRTSASYNAHGDVSETIDRLGRSTRYTYDEVDRPIRIEYADAIVTNTFDLAGRLTHIADTQSGSIDRTYDEAGRILSETTAPGLVSYSYNSASQRASLTVADRQPVAYGYDLGGRLSTITQGSEVFTYQYDLLSRRKEVGRPNGVTTSYQYNPAGRLSRLTHSRSQVIEDLQYIYSKDDELVGMTSSLTGTQLPLPKNANAANAANRLSQFGSDSFTFDEEGKTSSRTGTQGTTSYSWDARGRLKQVQLPNAQMVSFNYDPLGRRTSRTVEGISTTFLYDGRDVVLDRRSDGPTVDYLNGQDVDEKLRQTSAATGPLYFLQDQHNSTIALVNSGGGISESAQYEAFGESTGYDSTRYGYTGRERDADTGLMYYRARWYDPSQGRFLSEDPIGFLGGTNFYAYVDNNPLTNTDPSGLLRNCDAEHIDCFNRCYNGPPPWPCGPKKSGRHYRACQTKCLAEYMECELANEAERAAEAAKQVAQWVRDHPYAAIGTLVLIAGVIYIVVNIAGLIILVPLAA